MHSAIGAQAPHSQKRSKEKSKSKETISSSNINIKKRQRFANAGSAKPQTIDRSQGLAWFAEQRSCSNSNRDSIEEY
jgi:hypothetical protein